MGGYRLHPYGRPKDYGKHWRPLRGVRQHRKGSAHSSIVPMGDVAMSESAAKRAKVHEAQLIPGIDGIRTFGFPNSIITKLRYCDQIQVTSTLGAMTGYVFAANGIFDPDVSGTGHQPMFRDNYAAIYDQYVVIGSKITVTMTNVTASNTCVWGINGDDDAAGSATLTTKMEQNNSVWNQLGPTGSGADTSTLVCTFEPQRDFGVDAKSDGASQTVISANPSELWCYQVWMAGSGANTITCQFTVEIDYTVKWAELVTPTQN